MGLLNWCLAWWCWHSQQGTAVEWVLGSALLVGGGGWGLKAEDCGQGQAGGDHG